MKTLTQKRIGGDFLIKTTSVSNIYTTEYKSEEVSLIQESVKQFLQNNIYNKLELRESPEGIKHTPTLLKKAGDLGFLSLEVSEPYGGMDLSLKDTLHFVEEICKGYSFSGAIGVQISIGITPMLLYGTPYLKDKYLPKMMSGELLSAFALTEPNAGSDANAGKTKATINTNGNYSITGQKAWISNAAVADVFIVFAKIEDDKNLSAFVVEKDFDGITIGAEENKMGLKGWSTCQVFFDQVKVPKQNLLGVRNKGLTIALNTLNTGRIKLGTSGISNSVLAINNSILYARVRQQFGKSIAEFGAIQDKLAKMSTKIFALESLIYRLANDIDLYKNQLLNNNTEPLKAKINSLKEYRIECAIAKVFGSEIQDFCVDEGLQIHGGIGYSAEVPMERLYRSARISRIYEGTNEINRLVIFKEFIKKGMNGELDIMSSYTNAISELDNHTTTEEEKNNIQQNELIVNQLKKLAIIIAGESIQEHMQQIGEEQEMCMHIADMLIQIYALESSLLRVQKLVEDGKILEDSIHFSILNVLAFNTIKNIKASTDEIIACFDNEERIKTLEKAKKLFTKTSHKNIKNLRRSIAIHLINQETYSV